MRVFFDGVMFGPTGYHGMARLAGEVIRRMPEDWQPVLGLRGESGGVLPEHPLLRVVQFPEIAFRPRRFVHPVNLFCARHLLRSLRPDVVHPTGYWPLVEGLWDDAPGAFVYTVPDMIIDTYPEIWDRDGRIAAVKKRAIERADHIICISESGKSELLRFHRVPEEKITVAYLGSHLGEADAQGAEPVPSAPYFLYVGSRNHHKNYALLVPAFARVGARHGEVRLSVVGPPFTDLERAQWEDLGLAGRVDHWGQAEPAHLAKLYRHSLALVYPSRHEGFGLPVLEAMSCGTVVIAGNRTSIPEVAGDAGLLFDPDSEDALVDLMDQVFRDQALRDRHIALGREQAKKFSWDENARQTIESYRLAIESKPRRR